MARAASEEFPAAPETTRQKLFAGIGELALRGPQSLPSARRAWYIKRGLQPDAIPEFIRCRLPTTNMLETYTVRAVASRTPLPGSVNLLTIRRTTPDPQLTHVSEWDVSYHIRDDSQQYATERDIAGIRYRAIPPPQQCDFGGSTLAWIVAVSQWESGRETGLPIPLSDAKEPWPQAGLVAPEAEQLLALIDGLQQVEPDPFIL